MINRNIRSYEVSVWTLQDSFITVLKTDKLESKGQLQDPIMHISNDGTLEFSFTIPMYLHNGIEQKENSNWFNDGIDTLTTIENPLWKNTVNGTIMADTRKIKVIFNKHTNDEEVFEFMIIKVTERHEKDEKWCDVSCEGLAFQELGKIGYKLSLTQDTYILDWCDWADEEYDITNNAAVSAHDAREPRNNINYWCDKVFANTKWRYSIQMDYAGYDGIVYYKDGNQEVTLVDSRNLMGTIESDKIVTYFDLTKVEQAAINAQRESLGLRRNDKIYEDEYVSGWHYNESNETLSPSQITTMKEKERLIDCEESNIYNITQSIAETFGVFCRYKYHYDDTYHIIDREVIFYNNFIQEATGHIDLTYPYHTSAITREMDSSDLVTKMYVKTLSDDSTASGLVSIMDTEANKSREDYLLNFDYLRTIGDLTQEQYDEIEKYEAKLHSLYLQIIPLEELLETLNAQLPDKEADVTIAQNAVTLDIERISASDDLLNAITKDTGTLHVTAARPAVFYILESSTSGVYYLNLREHGIYPNTVKVFKTWNSTTSTLEDEVKTFTKEYDEFGNLVKLNNLYKASSTESSKRYVTYDYRPKLYYENIKKIWEERLAKDQATLLAAQTALDSLNEQISINQPKYDALIEQKTKIVAYFERLMGPALREGNWLPDDEYAGYGNNYSDTLSLTNNSLGASGYTKFIWDNELFDDEQDNKFLVGTNTSQIYYPCINLTNYISRFKKDHDGMYNLANAAFIFNDAGWSNINDPRYLRYYPIGSTSQFVFLRKNNVVIPALMITGIESLNISASYNTFNSVNIKNYIQASARIGDISTVVSGGNVNINIKEIMSNSETSNAFIDASGYEIVYPRINVASMGLKTSSDELSIKISHDTSYELLSNYEDFYILTRDAEYFITLKPETIFDYGSLSNKIRIDYCISDAATAIYLDAIQVLKENAYPKVSYTIDVSMANEAFIHVAYKCLNKIVHINDNELKFQNIQGYISELELDLDHPWEDIITIKNYKTKFEDLFSTIVAETESMKKNSYIVGMAAQAFTTTGEINPSKLQSVFDRVDLNYAFNNGKLTIDEKNGIWGISDAGVVAFRGGGIFTASAKDSNGNWIWNTGILPTGINASLITTGQLDTNLINIYAGDDVKFQMNGDGIFAYKSWLEDLPTSDSAIIKRNDYYKDNTYGLNVGQYIVYNSEGLFLNATNGSWVLNSDKTDYIELDRDVTRVEVSWDGFKIRNWDNEEVFFADGEGNLYLAGSVFADQFIVYDSIETYGTEEDPGHYLVDYLNLHFEDHVKVSGNLKVIFDNAGAVIKSSLTAIADLEDLTLENATILQGFYDNIAAGLKDDRTIQLYGSSNVDIYSGSIEDENTISVLSLSKDKGVWIGSGKAVNLFSGTLPNGNTATGSSVSLDSEKIKFGVSNTGAATVVEMTKDYAIFAAAEQVSQIEGATDAQWEATNSSVSGVKITKDGIRLATGTGNNRSLISMTPGNLMLGVAAESGNDGSFIKLSQSEMKIGASTNIYINANNIGLDTLHGDDNAVGFRLGSIDNPVLKFVNGYLYLSEGLQIGTGGTSSTINDYVQDQISDAINDSDGSISTYVTSITDLLQEQIDGEIDTWFFQTTPSPRTSSKINRIFPQEIEDEWGLTSWNSTTGYNENDLNIIQRHNSDVYYDISVPTYDTDGNQNNTAGHAFRFIVQKNNNGEIFYYWSEITDTTTTAALAAAANAQATADSKIKTFYAASEPTAEDYGDLWVNTSEKNKLYRWNGKAWAAVQDGAIAEAQAKADNAYEFAEKINSGEKGILFDGGTVTGTLNRTDGLKIVGNSDGSYFQVKNNAMGFFDSNNNYMLAYRNGNMWLQGGIIASMGHIGPWYITNDAIYQNDSALGSSDSIYLGTKGLGFGSVFTIALDSNQILNSWQILTENDSAADYLLKLEKSQNGDEDALYSLSLKNISLDADFIQSLLNNVDTGIYRATSQDKLPNNVLNGSLGIVYAEGIKSSTSTYSASNISSSLGSNYLIAGYSVEGHSKQTYFGLYRTRWNVALGSADGNQISTGLNSKYGRVGIAATPSNTSATFSPIQLDGSISSGQTVTINFTYRTMQENSSWDRMYDRYTRSPYITVKVFSSSPTVSNPTTVAQGTFTVPFTTGNINTTERTGAVDVLTSASMNSGSTYYVMFTSSSNYSLIYVRQDSVKIGNASTISNKATRAICVRDNGGWYSLASVDSAGDFTLSAATTSSLGGIKIPTSGPFYLNNNDALGLHYNSNHFLLAEGYLYLKLASSGGLTSDTTGLKINVGTGLAINSSGQLYATTSSDGNNGTTVTASASFSSGTTIGTITINDTQQYTYKVPIASSSQLGLVKAGTNITIASDGTINATTNSSDEGGTVNVTTSGFYSSGLSLGSITIGNNSAITYRAPYATTDSFGVVKIGSGLSVNNGVISVSGSGGTVSGSYLPLTGGTTTGSIMINATNNPMLQVQDGTIYGYFQAYHTGSTHVLALRSQYGDTWDTQRAILLFDQTTRSDLNTALQLSISGSTTGSNVFNIVHSGMDHVTALKAIGISYSSTAPTSSTSGTAGQIMLVPIS